MCCYECLKRWCSWSRKQESIDVHNTFMDTLEKQHKKDNKIMKLKEKLLNEKLDYLESITIII